MKENKEKIKAVKEEVIERNLKPMLKRVSIIYDGKQYNIRIPKSFAEKAEINPDLDEFEFELSFPSSEAEEYLPTLKGEIIEKERKKRVKG